MPKIDNAKPCPFCSSQHQSFLWDMEGLVSVQCVCAAKGPTGYSEDHALKQWNHRG